MAILKIVSAGKDIDQIKDQDRADFYEKGREITAVVCDGVFTSTNPAEAAQYVVESAEQIFDHADGLKNIVSQLMARRHELAGRPVDLSSVPPSMHRMLEEIAREKRQKSHQTTLIAMRWSRDKEGLKWRWIGCGDSAAFIFSPHGKLRWDSLGLNNEQTPLPHGAATLVLPDSYRETQFTVEKGKSYPYDSCVLLCSDGFYDTFDTFAELFKWVRGNYAALADPEQKNVLMAALHEKLGSKKGDDDISIVLDCPAFAKQNANPAHDERLLARIDNIKEEFDADRVAIRTELDQLSTDIVAFQTDVHEMRQTQMPQFQHKFKAHTAQIHAFNERYEQLETKVKHHTENLQNQCSTLAADVAQSATILQSLREQLALLKRQTEGKVATSWADNLSGVLATCVTETEAIQRRLSTLQTCLALEQQVVYSKLEIVEGSLANYLTHLRQLEGQWQNERQRVRTDIEETQQTLTAVTNEIVTVGHQFSALSERIALGEKAIRRELDILGTQLAHYITEAQDIWRRMENNTDMIKELEKRLDNIEMDLKSLHTENRIIKILLAVCLVICLALIVLPVLSGNSGPESATVLTPTLGVILDTTPTIEASATLEAVPVTTTPVVEPTVMPAATLETEVSPTPTEPTPTETVSAIMPEVDATPILSATAIISASTPVINPTATLSATVPITQ
ncbi:MAG: protein phosphatase 2C domain-containing protein [Caldilineaceae bacterium]|nr:protein phosphatase 2C domain-containing protein [Caldilineaceae bacterium]MBP8107542.1 protein phosphatase 2C domain-containing protein [Caldilineaceae bacterium]MBP8122480.1 protein phosphatase 2C domain-containing protein [Caldilineaceae bacterium]